MAATRFLHLAYGLTAMANKTLELGIWKLYEEICLHVNNCKHGESTKVSGYVWQMCLCICISGNNVLV